MNALVSTVKQSGVAVLTLDNPPVNVLSAPLRRALGDAIGTACADAAVQAVVLICAGRTFIAGADITEFGKPQEAPDFATLLGLIESAPKPIVAAIHGTALGGGFELALACHYRVMAAGAKVGLPEVKLGLLPGAGGTQRLPRIVGAEVALDLITSGRQVPAAEALSLGLVDRVVPAADLAAQAVALARDAAERQSLPRIRDMTEQVELDRARPDLFEAFARANGPRFRGLKAPGAIIRAVKAAVSLPFDDGLELEQALCQELMATTEAAAQQHVFFAERGTAKVPDLSPDIALVDIRSVGVIGAGTMGGGITMNFLNVGIPVTLVETSQAALDRGIGVIRRNYEGAVGKGRMTAGQRDQRMALITPVLDMTALAEADLIIEAVYESMDVKKAIFATLDGIARHGAILASNTSFLDLDEIASATNRPDRVVGLHFFSPANVMRLLEVVRGAATAPSVVATAMKLAQRIGKVPVLSRVCPGFIANRLLAPRGAQAEALALEGTPVDVIDKALFDYGFAMGHFQMMDLVGLDVVGRNADERTVMGDLVAAGRLGQKSGAGYYDYDERRRPDKSPLASRIIAEVATARGVSQAPTADGEALLERLLLPVVNEGARILDENIALRAADIDVAAILGYNWPVHTGGPMFWAGTIGLGRVIDGLQRLEARFGDAFAPSPLLVRLAASGASF